MIDRPADTMEFRSARHDSKVGGRKNGRPLLYLVRFIFASIVFVVNFHSIYRFLSTEDQFSSIDSKKINLAFRQLAFHSPPEIPPFRESIAILIAGQCHRLTYKDQSGPLFATFSGQAYPYKIDVYMALQCGEKFQPFTGQADTPKYMETLNVTDIEQWYLSKGANSVTINVLYDQTLDAIYQDVSTQASSIYRGDAYPYKLEYLLGGARWPTEVRKYYLRHLVFSMAQKAQRYSAYLMLREDNFFFEPIDMDATYFKKNKSNDENPYFIVDKHCEFGSYSDKIYISNHPGAASLFSSTKGEFMLFMKRLLLFAYYRGQTDQEIMQAERFEHDTIQFAVVDKMDLKRFDTRYVHGQRCVPNLYFFCQPASHKTAAYQHGLQICEKVSPVNITA